ncbi:hypothetical protein R1flu_020618 [Riccia fluitans]|uniref:Xyloglucan endotransglucosylase/hydrolase n=1 Tax=Riccia fluitans TaxID=41844 RepID=A0ABD1ZNI7_9MARC
MGKFSGIKVLVVLALVAIVSSTVDAEESRRIGPSLVSQFPSRDFDEYYSVIWGSPKMVDADGQDVQLTLDRKTGGGGFSSKNRFHHGFFSAKIRLPGNYSAGVVTAFYTSNADVYPKSHDELDFEFLGVVPGTPYTVQTNIYGNGSTSTGREERFHLWFDPTEDYHHYSILWNKYHTVFFVDGIPIREMVRSEALGKQYPTKAMTLYATLWDGSHWATQGGKYPVNYDLAPFKASFKDLKLEGCVWNEAAVPPPCAFSSTPAMNKLDEPQFWRLDHKQRLEMRWARSNYMWYSYCNDLKRYPAAPVECPSRSDEATTTTTTFRHHDHRHGGHGQHKREKRILVGTTLSRRD